MTGRTARPSTSSAPQMRAVAGAGARHVHAAAAMHDAASNGQKRGRDDAVPGAFERARAHFQEVRAPGEAVKAPSRMAQLTSHLRSCRRSSSKSPSMQSRDAEAAHGMRTRCVRFSSAAGLNLQQSPHRQDAGDHHSWPRFHVLSHSGQPVMIVTSPSAQTPWGPTVLSCKQTQTQSPKVTEGIWRGWGRCSRSQWRPQTF